MTIASRKVRAFSLVEVMISIAMVLLIMIGVVKVFQYTANTIGTGLGVAEVNRSQRGTLSAFMVDIGGFQRVDSAIGTADASPALVIRSQNTSTLLDKNTATPANFRTDTLGLFSRGSFRRQTSNKGALASDTGMASSQAWIWYGHLWLPDNNGAFSATTYPGVAPATANHNNYYATQWTLGRVIISLKNLNYPLTGTATDIAAGRTVQDHWTAGTTPNSMRPLSSASVSTTRHDTVTAFTLAQARYDIAGINSADTTFALPVAPQPFDYFRARTNSPGVANWWTELSQTPPSTVELRFQANPFPTKPFDASVNGINGGSAKMAQTFPIFLPHCSDFRVEFAGDFGTQDATTGAATSAAGDNILDFEITSGVRSIKWYGLGKQVGTFYSSTYSFERTAPAGVYMCAWGGPSALPYADAVNEIDSVPAADRRPKLLRITCTVHDANGRITDGQRYEYVINFGSRN